MRKVIRSVGAGKVSLPTLSKPVTTQVVGHLTTSTRPTLSKEEWHYSQYLWHYRRYKSSCSKWHKSQYKWHLRFITLSAILAHAMKKYRKRMAKNVTKNNTLLSRLQARGQ